MEEAFKKNRTYGKHDVACFYSELVKTNTVTGLWFSAGSHGLSTK